MEKFAFVVPSIAARLKAVIETETEETGRFGWLQRKTGISRNTWQTWWDKEDASPSGKMIEAIARLWPKYAYWLATGSTDAEYGHTLPSSLPKSTPWPEYGGVKAGSGAEYFNHCIAMQDKLSSDPSYINSKEWEKDWEKLNDAGWDREIGIYSTRIIFRSYEERLKARSARENPWIPDSGDGFDPDAE